MIVKTNLGDIPIDDYLDIKACQYGFDSYEDLKEAGLMIDYESVEECNE